MRAVALTTLVLLASACGSSEEGTSRASSEEAAAEAEAEAAELAVENLFVENLIVEDPGAWPSGVDANMATEMGGGPAASPGEPDTNTINMDRPKRPSPR